MNLGEVFCGRLEPIVSHIKHNPRSMVCPMIDVINDRTLSYSGTGESSVGGFWWSLHFKWITMQQSDAKRRTSPTDPYR